MNDEIVAALKGTLYTAGWREVMVPALLKSIDHVKAQLVLSPDERQTDFSKKSEDFMRGQAQALAWVVNVWDSNIQVYEKNARAEKELNEQHNEVGVGSPYAEGANGS